MGIKLSGVDAMKANLKKAAVNARTQIKSAVEAEANRLFEEAKARVPVKTGALRGSGKVTTLDDGTTVKAVMSFGNEQVDYAIEVHEKLEAHHPRGEAKFLESVLNEEAPSLAADLARRIDIAKS